MKVEDFNYNLPEKLIAQSPLEERSSSRLLIIDRKNNALLDKSFYQIIDYLDENDVLVLNDTKVLPSRIFGRKIKTNAKIEVLLLKEDLDYWEVLIRPARRIKVGDEINFNGLFEGQVLRKFENGIAHIKFHYEGIFLNLLDKLGQMPLPPYIHNELKDKDRYQTVYARDLGSAAAPTAGLHFDQYLLDQLQKKQIEIAYITLHIGLGTFRGVSASNVEEHIMHSEYYFLSKETAALLNKAKASGKNIISVGTTSTRTLETVYAKYGCFQEDSGQTDIFIYPGYNFSAIDGLITNFHLPKSTLIMLVSAFYSRDKIMEAYDHAIKEGYRFFSFGDAMFIK